MKGRQQICKAEEDLVKEQNRCEADKPCDSESECDMKQEEGKCAQDKSKKKPEDIFK